MSALVDVLAGLAQERPVAIRDAVTTATPGTVTVGGAPVAVSRWVNRPEGAGQRVLLLMQGGTAVAIGQGGSGPSGDYVARAGDTMTGALTINPPAGLGLLELNGNDAGTLWYGELAFQRNGVSRWLLRTNNNTEPGNNSGADFAVLSRNDDGSARATPLTISRSTGQTTISSLASPAVQINGAGIRYNHTHSGGTTNNIGFRWASPNIVANVDVTGNIVVGTLSDRRLKAGIAPLPEGLPMVEALRPVTYWPVDLDGSVPPGSRQHVGLVADEVEQVIPTAVNRPEDPGGFASLNHAEIVPVLIRAVQELSARVAELEAR